MSDTEEIITKWLQVCPPCDAGIGAPCTHPDEDYRPVILMLLNQRDGARKALGDAIDESRRLRDQLRHADHALAAARKRLAKLEAADVQS